LAIGVFADPSSSQRQNTRKSLQQIVITPFVYGLAA
jgi:hypothetical protein